MCTSIPLQHRSGASLVIGVNGQDGSYLAQSLIKLGRPVIGVGRQDASRYVAENESFTYRKLDIADTVEFVSFLNQVSPDKIFHLAAIHGAAGFKYEENWYDIHAVSTIAVHAILEYLRRKGQGSLLYTSSSKAFGADLIESISERTTRRSSCIYSTTKNAATDLINYYRQRYGVCSSVLWTFNHESPRRGGDYFIPKLVDCLFHALQDPHYTAEFFTLNFYADWSDAAELMDIAIDVSDNCPSEDFIFASGKTLFARDLVKDLFHGFGLDYRSHVVELYPNEEVQQPWTADITKMKKQLGRRPTSSVLDICESILRENYNYFATRKG